MDKDRVKDAADQGAAGRPAGGNDNRMTRSVAATPRDHPHLGASYQIVPRNDADFGVEVTIPGTSPTTVTALKLTASCAEKSN